jgi:hypothetical protein
MAFKVLSEQFLGKERKQQEGKMFCFLSIGQVNTYITETANLLILNL